MIIIPIRIFNTSRLVFFSLPFILKRHYIIVTTLAIEKTHLVRELQKHSDLSSIHSSLTEDSEFSKKYFNFNRLISNVELINQLTIHHQNLVVFLTKKATIKVAK